MGSPYGVVENAAQFLACLCYLGWTHAAFVKTAQAQFAQDALRKTPEKANDQEALANIYAEALAKAEKVAEFAGLPRSNEAVEEATERSAFVWPAPFLKWTISMASGGTDGQGAASIETARRVLEGFSRIGLVTKDDSAAYTPIGLAKADAIAARPALIDLL